MVDHLSEWHNFDPNDQSTYPKVDAPVQVRYSSGALETGQYHEFFQYSNTTPELLIAAWRYIKDNATR